MDKIGKYEPVKVIDNGTLDLLMSQIDSKREVGEKREKNRIREVIEIPQELKHVCSKSELEKEFDYREAAFEYYREKMNIEIGKKKDSVFTVLFSNDVDEKSRDNDFRFTIKASPTGYRQQPLSLQRHVRENNIKHIQNIEVEKIMRRKRLRKSKLEGRYRNSDIELSNQKKNLEDQSAATEGAKITFSRTDFRKTSNNLTHRRVKTEGQGWHVRSGTNTSIRNVLYSKNISTSNSVSRRKTIYSTSKAIPNRDVRTIKTKASRTDGFSGSFKYSKNHLIDLNDGINKLSQVMTEPDRPKSSHFVPSRKSSHIRKGILSVSREPIALSVVSLDKNTEMSAYQGKLTLPYTAPFDQTASGILSRDLLANSIFSFCKEKVAEKRQRQLYRRIQMKKTQMGII
jgi:hypothetical protein